MDTLVTVVLFLLVAGLGAGAGYALSLPVLVVLALLALALFNKGRRSGHAVSKAVMMAPAAIFFLSMAATATTVRLTAYQIDLGGAASTLKTIFLR